MPTTLEEMHAAALKIGTVEWGSTHEHTPDEHAAHVKKSVEITSKHFEQEGPQKMHGLYVTGSGTVIGHTGTSPNSPTHARILTALWNRFVEEAKQALSENTDKPKEGGDDVQSG